MRDRVNRWLANRLPKRLVYFAAIRLITYATTGRYGTTIVPELPAMTALKRWERTLTYVPGGSRCDF